MADNTLPPQASDAATESSLLLKWFGIEDPEPRTPFNPLAISTLILPSPIPLELRTRLLDAAAYFESPEYCASSGPSLSERRSLFLSATAGNINLTSVRRWHVWKDSLVALLDAQLARYPVDSGPSPSTSDPSNEHGRNPSSTASAAHRVLNIAELVEQILYSADLQTQLHAGQVCTLWRATVKRILQDPFENTPHQNPVEYSDVCSTNNVNLRVTPEELLAFEEKVHAMCSILLDTNGWNIWTYAPARLTQSHMLKPSVAELVRYAYRVAWDINPVPDNDFKPQPQWLDFTQFTLHPCLERLCTGGFETHRGRCHIYLNTNAATEGLLHPLKFPLGPLYSHIGSHFVTDPPCSCIGIYTPSDQWLEGTAHINKLVTRIYNKDGIRLSHLTSILNAHAATVLLDWRDQVERMRENLATLPPSVLQLSYPRRRAFTAGARPHFILTLDHHDMDENPNLSKHVSQRPLLMGMRMLGNEWKTLDIAEQYVDTSSECWAEWISDTSADDSLWSI